MTCSQGAGRSTWDLDWENRRGVPEEATSPSRTGTPKECQEILRKTGRGGQLPGRNVSGLGQPAGIGPDGLMAFAAGDMGIGQGPVRRVRSTGAEMGNRWQKELAVEMLERAHRALFDNTPVRRLCPLPTPGGALLQFSATLPWYI